MSTKDVTGVFIAVGVISRYSAAISLIRELVYLSPFDYHVTISSNTLFFPFM